MSCAVFHCFNPDEDFRLAIWRRDERWEGDKVANVITAVLPNNVTVEFEAEWGEKWQCTGIKAWQMNGDQRGLELTAKRIDVREVQNILVKSGLITGLDSGEVIQHVDFMLVDAGMVRIRAGAWTHPAGRWFNTKVDGRFVTDAGIGDLTNRGVKELPSELR